MWYWHIGVSYDNILQEIPAQESTNEEISPNEEESHSTKNEMPPGVQMHSLKLALSSGRNAQITIPSDINKRDVEKLKNMLDLLARDE